MSHSSSTLSKAKYLLRGASFAIVAFVPLLTSIVFAQQATPQDDTYTPSSISSTTQSPPGPDTSGDDDVMGRIEANIRARGVPTPDAAQNLLNEAAKQRSLYPNQVFNPGNGVGSWQSEGPSGDKTIQNGPFTLKVVDSGRLRTILPHPTDEKTVYVLSSGGGLWKTEDFNSQHPTWQAKTDQVGTTSGGYAAFGRMSETLYLGLGDPFDTFRSGGAVLKSSNGGDTWSSPIQLPFATRIMDVKVDTSQSTDIVLVGTDVGLYRSTDGGVTYNSSPIFPGKLVWSLAQSNVGWVASVQSSDPTSSTVTISAKPTKLYLSVDHGATWNPTGTGFATNATRTTLGVGAPGDAIVYAFASQATSAITFDQLDLYRSNDGGISFSPLGVTSKTPTNPDSGFPGQSNMDLMREQAWYNQLLLVDPTDPARNTVYLGGEFASARTTDGGSTWTLTSDWLAQSNLPYVHADFHAAAIRSGNNGKTIFFGTDGGLFISTDNGSTFASDKNRGLRDQLLYSISVSGQHPEQTLIGLQDDGTRFSFGGPLYNQVLGGDGIGTAWSQANDFVSMTTVPFNRIFRCTSNPPSDISKFTLASHGLFDYFFNVLTGITTPTSSTDPTGQVFFTWTPTFLWVSFDGAGQWSFFLHIDEGDGFPFSIKVGPPFTAFFRDVPHNVGVAPNDSQFNHIGVAMNGGRTAISNDSANTWSVSRLNREVPGFFSFTNNVTWANNTDVYVTSVQPAPSVIRVVKSTQGGGSGTWHAAQNGLADVPVNRLLVDLRDPSGQSLFAATDLGVYHTLDGGGNWTLFGSGLPQVAVTDLYMPADGSFLRIATYGRGVWEIKLR